MLPRPDSALRIFLGALGFVGALFAPVWVPVLAMIALALRYRAIEAMFLGLFIDLLWLPSVGFPVPFPICTAVGIAIVWLFEPLRREFLL